MASKVKKNCEAFQQRRFFPAKRAWHYKNIFSFFFQLVSKFVPKFRLKYPSLNGVHFSQNFEPELSVRAQSVITFIIFRPTFSMGEENHDLLFSDPHFQWGRKIMICVAFFFPNFAKIPLCTIPLPTQSPYSAILILSCIYPVLFSYTILIV